MIGTHVQGRIQGGGPRGPWPPPNQKRGGPYYLLAPPKPKGVKLWLIVQNSRGINLCCHLVTIFK